nr:hypothetical protein [Collimonas pratensis]
MTALRAPSIKHWRPGSDLLLYLHKNRLIDDRRPALGLDPVRLRLHRLAVMLAAIENRVAGICMIFQQVGNRRFGPWAPTICMPAVVHAHGDRLRASTALTQRKYLAHDHRLRLQHIDPLAVAVGDGLITERRAATIEIPFFSVFHHAPLRVLADPSAGALVHHLQQGLDKPALVRFCVDRHRHIHNVGAVLAQLTLV